jgi:hypothetical protein
MRKYKNIKNLVNEMDPWFENFKLMLTYWLMSNRDPTMAEAALTSRTLQLHTFFSALHINFTQ